MLQHPPRDLQYSRTWPRTQEGAAQKRYLLLRGEVSYQCGPVRDRHIVLLECNMDVSELLDLFDELEVLAAGTRQHQR